MEPPAPTEPAIKWYPRDIGYPLISDDPAAEGKKVVMLTFDDGPSASGSTARILDILKENEIKALFFITGYGAKNLDLVEREYREGHVLGNHTDTHPNMRLLSVAEMREEIEPVNAVIEQVTGQKPKYFRPPFGAYNQALIDLLAEEYHLDLINWSDGSNDWVDVVDGYKDPALIVADVMEQLHPGAVILMHDTNQHTADALPEIIRQIRAEGYEFVVMQ